MTAEHQPEDELFERLRGGYDVTEGIPPAAHDHGSVRRVEHASHRLEIHTHYRVFIDGEEFPDPIHVATTARSTTTASPSTAPLRRSTWSR
jgi:hypothetical protein